MYISGIVICQRGFIQVSAPDSETGKTSPQSRIGRDGARLRLFATWAENVSRFRANLLDFIF